MPLLRVTGQLADMIPVARAEAAGLAVSGYVLPGADFQTVLVSIAASADARAAIGVAGGRLVGSTAPVAFLRALAAALCPPGAAHHLAWRCRLGDVAWLDRAALEADLTRADELAFWEGLPDWADIARRRFGHEPVVFSAGASGLPAKVICPGASCYRPRDLCLPATGARHRSSRRAALSARLAIPPRVSAAGRGRRHKA